MFYRYYDVKAEKNKTKIQREYQYRGTIGN